MESNNRVNITYTSSHNEDRLAEMLRLQAELQQIMPPIREFPASDLVVLMAQIRENILACTDELHEAMNETGWKPWASESFINNEAFRNELVDAWHFFMNLMILGGMTADDLYEGYLAKRKINAQRQIDGYDGVSTKCPGCKRALDDPTTECYYNSKFLSYWCANPQSYGERSCPKCHRSYDDPSVKCIPARTGYASFCVNPPSE